MDTLYISSIQRFCMHDGEGVRTTIFLKGCPLKCKWCHNPENIIFEPQVMYFNNNCIHCKKCSEVCENDVHSFDNGFHKINKNKCTNCKKCTDVCPTKALSLDSKSYTLEDIVNISLKDKDFYGKKGGITLSGGEPLLYAHKILNLEKLFLKNHVKTNIETSCNVTIDAKLFEELVKNTNEFLIDYKDSNEERLFENTNASLTKILNNIRFIDDHGGKIVLRCIMIKGINMEEKHYLKIVELYKSLKNIIKVDLIPFHPFASNKYDSLGQEYTMDRSYIPSSNELKSIKKYLETYNLKVSIQ